jgi:hypothetical protein
MHCVCQELTLGTGKSLPVYLKHVFQVFCYGFYNALIGFMFNIKDVPLKLPILMIH